MCVFQYVSMCVCAHRHTHTHTHRLPIIHRVHTYIRTIHTASVLYHPSPTPPPSGAFGKVYKGVLILPAYSPQQGYTKTLVAVKTIKSQCVHGAMCVWTLSSVSAWGHMCVWTLSSVCLDVNMFMLDVVNMCSCYML